MKTKYPNTHLLNPRFRWFGSESHTTTDEFRIRQQQRRITQPVLSRVRVTDPRKQHVRAKA